VGEEGSGGSGNRVYLGEGERTSAASGERGRRVLTAKTLIPS